MYKTILVPVDLGHEQCGDRAAGIARAIGGREARVILLYVLADVPSYVIAELPKGLLQKNAQKAEEGLRKIAAPVKAEIDVKTGHPSTEILSEAKRLGADLIVISSHRPGLQDYFLGSTAARVARHAPCAVLVDR